jgi:hypothetical protein
MKVKDIKPPQQHVRKKLWWLIMLLPVVWVVATDTFDLADKKRVEIVKEESRTLPEVLKDGDLRIRPLPSMERKESVEGEDVLIDEKYWGFIDNVIMRAERLWPLALSALAFFYRRKFVGDKT